MSREAGGLGGLKAICCMHVISYYLILPNKLIVTLPKNKQKIIQQKKRKLLIYCRSRFGMKNLINTYLRLNIRVACRAFSNLKFVLIEFAILNLSLINFVCQKPWKLSFKQGSKHKITFRICVMCVWIGSLKVNCKQKLILLFNSLWNALRHLFLWIRY